MPARKASSLSSRGAAGTARRSGVESGVPPSALDSPPRRASSTSRDSGSELAVTSWRATAAAGGRSGDTRRTETPSSAGAEPAAGLGWSGRRFGPAGVAIALALALALFAAGGGYRYTPLPSDAPAGAARAAGAVPVELGSPPRGLYIVIDRTNNRLWLRRGDQTLLEAVCSAGSGSLLRDPNGSREWIFDTPTGVFRVRGKVERPIWRKPDWAFIEAGEPIPADPGKRLEYGVLGEYALDLGDGYLIHGTLYERLLGRSVTHGCIRVGRDDLRELYRATPVGTPVYVF